MESGLGGGSGDIYGALVPWLDFRHCFCLFLVFFINFFLPSLLPCCLS